MSPRPARERQIRRRRLFALGGLCAVAVLLYLVLETTVFAPADRHGATVVGLTIHGRDVGKELGVEVVVPAADASHTRGEPLLVFLHRHSGSDTSYTEEEPFFVPSQRSAGGRWGSYVTGEVIPTVVRRFHLDPHRVAIGGISMGGFGAYDLALRHPSRFCAVGGHSPALWLESGATARAPSTTPKTSNATT